MKQTHYVFKLILLRIHISIPIIIFFIILNIKCRSLGVWKTHTEK